MVSTQLKGQARSSSSISPQPATLLLRASPASDRMAPLARTALLVGVGVAGASYLAPAGPSRPLRAPPSCGAQNIVCAAALDASWRLPAVLEAKAAHNPLADLSQDHQWMLYRSTRYLREHEELIQRALAVAATAHSGQKRRSGEDFIMHPIETAVILAEVRPAPALRAPTRAARPAALAFRQHGAPAARVPLAGSPRAISPGSALTANSPSPARSSRWTRTRSWRGSSTTRSRTPSSRSTTSAFTLGPR